MKTITVLRAQPFPDQDTEGTIHIGPDLPKRTEPGEDWVSPFLDEAQRLELFLRQNLPGGTYDALFARMAAHKASGLFISNQQGPKT